MKKQTGGDSSSEEEETEDNLPPKLTPSAAAGSSGGSRTVSPKPATPSKSSSKGNQIFPSVTLHSSLYLESCLCIFEVDCLSTTPAVSALIGQTLLEVMGIVFSKAGGKRPTFLLLRVCAVPCVCAHPGIVPFATSFRTHCRGICQAKAVPGSGF